jgi:hypothetical protein
MMARANQGRDICADDGDRKLWLETLAAACEKTGWRLHAGVMMSHRYHLLLETPEANLVAVQPILKPMRNRSLGPRTLGFLAWFSAACLLVKGPEAAAASVNPTVPPDVFYVAGSTRKISQLIGDTDFQWLTPTKTLTESRFGITGSDLGVPFTHNGVTHKGVTYLVFGDTQGGGVSGDRDPLAFTTNTDLENGLQLTFYTNGPVWRPTNHRVPRHFSAPLHSYLGEPASRSANGLGFPAPHPAGAGPQSGGNAADGDGHHPRQSRRAPLRFSRLVRQRRGDSHHRRAGD